MVDELQALFQEFSESRLGLYAPSWMLCDQAGMLVDTRGIRPNLGVKPKPGQYVGDTIPPLASLFPLIDEVLHLPHVRLDQDRFFDIHIFDEQETVWVIFVETTPYAQQIQEVIQKYNQLKLANPETGGIEGFAILNQLGYTCFEYTGDQLFRPLGPPAEWSQPVYGTRLAGSPLVPLMEIHPFLEVFIEECQAFWVEASPLPLRSGIWVQQDDQDRSYFFRAEALHFDERKLLLIGPAENSAESVQELIQKARTKVLNMEQLERTKETLQNLLNFKNQFVSIISHDLRSPLSSVITLLQLLIDDILPKPDDERTVKDFLSSAKNELDLVLEYNQKVYNWTNLELGRLNIEPDWHPLSAMVMNSIRGSKSILGDKQIRVTNNLDQRMKILVDRSLFAHSIDNLVANAAKFTSKGGKIRIEGEFSDDSFKIHIIDNGVGMDDQTLRMCLSGQLVRSAQGTRGERGTGLGLSICKKVMEAHKFGLEVESKLGKGSKFTLTIPSSHIEYYEKQKNSAKTKGKTRLLKFF